MSVYTTLDNNDLRQFFDAFDVGVPIDLQGISDGIENTNYFVTTRDNNGKTLYVLTIFESLSHTELPFFLDLMAFLSERNVPCAHPVADRQSHYLQTLKSKPAALVQKLPGHSVMRPTLEHCRQVGAALGHLHAAAREFPGSRENPRSYTWFEDTASRLQPHLSATDQELLSAELAFQRTNREQEQIPRGIIHADLFRDNVLFEHGRLTGIIDFYYACHGPLLYDLAITVNDWCSTEKGTLKPDFVLTLLQAYQQQRGLLAAEKIRWPAMLRAAALRFWLSRLFDWHFPRRGAITHTKNPDEFKRILEQRICNHTQLQSLWVESVN
jgi:homoserine kinase type II